MLLTAMAVATFTAVALGLLASPLIDEFEVSRAAIGWVIAVNTVVAALLSPLAGGVTDAIGGRRALIGLFLVGATAFLILAGAPVFAVLFAGSAVAAVAQSSGNPATNKLIALHLPPGRRSVVTGVKQSGVQLGVFLGGLVVPSLAIGLGWRWTLVLVAVVPLLGIAATLAVVPGDAPVGSDGAEPPSGPLPPAIRWLAAYGFLLGFSGAVTFLIPLFVEESLGRSLRVAGLVAGLIGLVAVAGRILWARYAERHDAFARSLTAIAVGSVAAWLLFLGADQAAWWLVWPAAVAAGLSNSSWNSVAMLAVMNEAGAARSGGASGIVMLGFLAGLGGAPPLYGWTVDRTGSYVAMWLLAIAASVLGAVVSVAWSRRHSGGRVAPPT